MAKVISIRVSDEMYAKLCSHAEIAGTNVTASVLSIVSAFIESTGESVKAEVDERVISKLSQVASMLAKCADVVGKQVESMKASVKA